MGIDVDEISPVIPPEDTARTVQSENGTAKLLVDKDKNLGDQTLDKALPNDQKFEGGSVIEEDEESPAKK